MGYPPRPKTKPHFCVVVVAPSPGAYAKIGHPACTRQILHPSKNSKPLIPEALEDSGGAHTATHPHGYEPVARLAALEFAQNRGGKLRAGAAERMPESDGAAIGIYAARIDVGEAHDGQRLGGEGF